MGASLKTMTLALAAVFLGMALAAPVHLHQKPVSRVLTSFSFQDCAAPSAPMHGNLSLSPDPIVLPGNITGYAGIVLSSNLSSPKATVEMKKGIIKVPCVDNFGSCTYDDLCSFLEKIPLKNGTCPDPMPAMGIPCRCPLTPFSAFMPERTFHVSESLPGILDGDYDISAEITDGSGNQVACVKLSLALKSA